MKRVKKSKYLGWGLCLGLIAGVAFSNSWQQRFTERGCHSLNSQPLVLSAPQKDPDSLKFIAVGDIGQPHSGQNGFAQTMAKVCQAQGCDFIVMLGDNFYPHGVKSIEDPLFEEVFESYAQQVPVPFFVVLGNHDIRGDVAAQVFYHYQNDQWMMPDFRYQLTSSVADLWAINTNCHLFDWWQLKNTFSPSTDSWQFVFGHHSLFSTGTHGDEDLALTGFWKSFFEGNVDFYVSGHNHHLEHLHDGKTHHVVSGAGSKDYHSHKEQEKRQSSQMPSKFDYSEKGFVWFEVTSDKVISQFIDASGKQQYQFEELRKEK